MESMRIEKDEEIKRITILIERQRNEYELQVNELQITLNKYQQNLVALQAKNLELDSHLAQKEDVEE